MRVVTLSGWGQPHDALQGIAPTSVPIDYARHGSVNAGLLDIGHQAQGADLAIGWSLGGQMLLRTIAADLLKVKRVVLIAAPFQFVRHAESRLGMPVDMFQLFRDNYVKDPARTLTKARASIAKDDSRPASIRRQLEKQDKDKVLATDWLVWLNTLRLFTCRDVSFTGFPPTLIIHGRKDAVVSYDQSKAFMLTLPRAKLVTLEKCGHAPHWHNKTMVQRLIAEFVHV